MKITELGNARNDDRWDVYRDYRLAQQERQSGQAMGQAAGGTGETTATKRPGETDESAAPELGRECQTCKGRKYQDGSADPGVSFKTPTTVAPSQAAAAVRGHEQEHVTREKGKAAREDRKVVSQSVVYHNAICPECGRVYVSGGTTRTTTRGNEEPQPPQEKQSGQGGLNVYA